jgi:hypothetical protein
VLAAQRSPPKMETRQLRDYTVVGWSAQFGADWEGEYVALVRRLIARRSIVAVRFQKLFVVLSCTLPVCLCYAGWAQHHGVRTAGGSVHTPAPQLPAFDFFSTDDSRPIATDRPRASNHAGPYAGTRRGGLPPSSPSDSPISASIRHLPTPFFSWRTILGIELLLVGL